ncbi:HNH endonuclease [Candidatus Dojkabacteria bacterium]|jgi:hypothetical protein|nr:HNH endonuclease [Candidatus Dojkabacteria bacterium]
MSQILSTCQNCKREFITWEAWIKKGAGKNCSRECYWKSKKGMASYVRTPEHKLKMSSLIKANPCVLKASEHFKKLNHSKKGKCIEEIYGIEKATKIREKLRITLTGSNNPNYIDGRSFLPYAPDFTKLLKEKIIERDGKICKGCGLEQEELCVKDVFGRGLTIHHIDYDKSNNKEFNLISLCRKCNSGANGNREYYKNYYGKQI